MRGVFVLGLLALVAGQDNKPIVETHFGKVQGDTGLSRDNRMYYSFKGIPYAKADRFQVPEIPNNWEGVRDATKFGPVCTQYDLHKQEVVGDENCLHLNVFTPKLPKEGDHKVLLPVVFVLHPGAHNHGTGNTIGPKYFMDEDVVVVTLNYRLGVFGFLNTGDMYAQGNMGMKDQSAALRWVSNNIEKFGGDKNRVTILGLSAGGEEALMHILAPTSKNLIHGAIVHSGSPSRITSVIRDPIAQAKKLGTKVGCPIDSSKALVECLKGMNHLELVKKMDIQPIIVLDQLEKESIPLFGPTVEKILDGQTENDVVLSDIPYKLLSAGKIANKVPVIQGANDRNGFTSLSALMINNTETLSRLNEQWNELAPKVFNFAKTSKDPAAVAKKIRDFYFEGKEINADTKEKLIDIFTDRYFLITTRNGAKHYSRGAPEYLYIFTHTPEHNVLDSKFPNLKFAGAGHQDEIQYLFNCPPEAGHNIPDITKDSTPDELALSKGMVKLWSSFIETGKPTKTWGDAKEWKKAETTAEKPVWYKIDVNTKNLEEPDYFTKRMEFWNDLFKDQLTPELETPAAEKF